MVKLFDPHPARMISAKCVCLTGSAVCTCGVCIGVQHSMATSSDETITLPAATGEASAAVFLIHGLVRPCESVLQCCLAWRASFSRGSCLAWRASFSRGSCLAWRASFSRGSCLARRASFSAAAALNGGHRLVGAAAFDGGRRLVGQCGGLIFCTPAP